MVKIKNIKKENDRIFCDIYVEDCKVPMKTILCDDETYEIDDFPNGYDWCKTHVRYALRFLKTLFNEKDVPTQKTIMWY